MVLDSVCSLMAIFVADFVTAVVIIASLCFRSISLHKYIQWDFLVMATLLGMRFFTVLVRVTFDLYERKLNFLTSFYCRAPSSKFS
jgi:hypothetical protein